MVTCRKDQDWTEVMACQKKSDENEKDGYRAGSSNMFESVFMFVDAELNFSFFVLLGNDEFAVTVREGVDTVQDIFEQRNHWLTEVRQKHSRRGKGWWVGIDLKWPYG